MKRDHSDKTPEEIRRLAHEWYDRQLVTIAKAHGSEWPKHRDWVEDYLREELREHLQKRGLPDVF